MPGINEYIEQFGNRSFTELPFSDADNLVFSQLAYLDFETIVSPSFNAEPQPFSDVCNRLFAAHGYRHSPLGLVLPKDASVNSMRMAIQKRYSEMKVWAAKTAYGRSPALQFSAVTFLLPTGEAVVAFRGTDDTLAGWIEDMDIFLRDDIPAHACAVSYLKEVAAHTEGELILCGHSKGGHLALFSAVTADESIRNRIRLVFNNEGPGFRNYDLFATKAYHDLVPRYRHFVPHASIIGMMLAHDYDYKAVFSTKRFPLFQHDMASWQIVNGAVITRSDVAKISKIIDILFSEFPRSVSETGRSVLSATADKLSNACDEEHLIDIVRHFPRELNKALEAWFDFPKQSRKEFHAAFRPFPGLLKDTVKNIKEQSVPNAAKAAGVFLRKVTAQI